MVYYLQFFMTDPYIYCFFTSENLPCGFTRTLTWLCKDMIVSFSVFTGYFLMLSFVINNELLTERA